MLSRSDVNFIEVDSVDFELSRNKFEDQQTDEQRHNSSRPDSVFIMLKESKVCAGRSLTLN